MRRHIAILSIGSLCVRAAFGQCLVQLDDPPFLYPVYPTPPPWSFPTGGVERWTFDNTNAANNFVGEWNAYVLTNNAVVPFTETNDNEVARFDGLTSYLRGGDRDQYTLSTNGATITFWLKLLGANLSYPTDRIFGKTTSGTFEYQFGITYPSLTYWGLCSSNPLLSMSVRGPGLATNVWTFYALTWDGTTNATGLQIYSNATAVGSTWSYNGFTGLVNTTASLILGANEYMAGNFTDFLNGYLEDFIIYSNVLSSTDLQNIHTSSVHYVPPPDTNAPTTWQNPNTNTAILLCGFLTTNTDGNWISEYGGYILTNRYVNQASHIPYPVLIASNAYGKTTNKYAAYLEGSDSYIDIGNVQGLDACTNFTLSLWINSLESGTSDIWFNRLKDSQNGIQFRNDSTDYNDPQAQVRNAGASIARSTTSAIATTNVWYMVTLAFDGTQATDATKTKIYLDGTPLTLGSINTQPTMAAQTLGARTVLGFDYNSTQWSLTFFKGYMSYLSIYTNTLSAADIAAEYAHTHPTNYTAIP